MCIFISGSTFDDLSHIIFPEQILGSSDHRGFLFVRPTFQCLSKLIVPNTPFLVAILIHKWEVPWAKVFPLRLMLRLGAECRCKFLSNLLPILKKFIRIYNGTMTTWHMDNSTLTIHMIGLWTLMRMKLANLTYFSRNSLKLTAILNYSFATNLRYCCFIDQYFLIKIHFVFIIQLNFLFYSK